MTKYEAQDECFSKSPKLEPLLCMKLAFLSTYVSFPSLHSAKRTIGQWVRLPPKTDIGTGGITTDMMKFILQSLSLACIYIKVIWVEPSHAFM